MENGLTSSLNCANEESVKNENISNAVIELKKLNNEIGILKGAD